MKIWQSPYTLKLKKTSPKHIGTQGVLLCFESITTNLYNVYHPIASLGDPSIENFLDLLKREGAPFQEPQQKIQSLSLSREEHTEIDLNAYASCAINEDFDAYPADHIKLKISEIEDIVKIEEKSSDKIIILDANGQLSKEDYLSLKDSCKEWIQKNVKYIEDPYPQSQELTGETPDFFKVASDFLEYDSYSYKILKPTGYFHPLRKVKEKEHVVTSYLDHPLGQIVAGDWAVGQRLHNPCGLNSHTYFEKNEYSELLEGEGRFYFNRWNDLFHLLENEPWQRVL